MFETTLVFGSPLPYGDDPRILAETIGTAPVLAKSLVIHAEYLQQMLVPIGLRPEYVDAGASLFDPAVILCGLGLAALFGFGLLAGASGRRPLVAAVILGFFVLAIPTSNLFGMPNMQAERFMYLPSVPVALGLASAAVMLGRTIAARSGEPVAVLAPVLLLAVFQGSVLLATSAAYESNNTLWATASRRAPDSARALALRGLHLLADAGERTREDPAVAARIEGMCVAARAHDQGDDLPHLCLARLRVVQRRWPEAAQAFQRALTRADRKDRVLAGLVELGPDLSDEATERSLDLLARALDAYPYSPDLHFAGARLHHKLGRPEEALALYRRARSLRPERWETVVAALELALDLGDAAAALHTFAAERRLLAKADPTVRAALQRRITTARTSGPSLLQSHDSPGVF
jgi:tetratricopeptide (TPR) repeat protein